MTLRSDHPMSVRAYHELDISSSAFWARTFGERELTFARLRRDSQRAGLTWHEPFQANFPHAETGFWAATRHEDIGYISKHHGLFSSAEGVGVSPLPKQEQAAVSFFLMMDPPEHTVFRRLISAAFTPRNVARIQAQIEANAREIVDNLAGAGEVDFVTACSASQIRAGEKVALFYCSDNRDKSVFDRPGDFILSRSPNHHVGFGGGGVHYCLGSSVAKTQLRALFRELLTRLPDIEIGEPEWLPNLFVHGIKRLSARIGAISRFLRFLSVRVP